jgi:LysR family transcriptional regulator, glycine cleavage system transcriptional activator
MRPVIARADLPPLDLLRSFEAAARHLSFTLAAQELFLTQSAVSRQIQQVEANLGVALFQRRHRALELTEAGQLLQRAVVDCLERLRDVTARVRATTALRQVSMTCTPGFASLWLIPRLARFTADHPAVDVRISATMELLDLERTQVDLAVRFCPIQAGSGAPLFEESVVPVCAPRLVSRRPHPLKEPADLAQHTLLAVDMPQGMALTVDWEPWIRVMGLTEVRMKNSVRFTQYADAIAAAVAGQGVAIGRLPLLAELLQSKRLVAPFGGNAASQRGYYVVMSERGARNAAAQDFVNWLRAEAEMTRGSVAANSHAG